MQESCLALFSSEIEPDKPHIKLFPQAVRTETLRRFPPFYRHLSRPDMAGCLLVTPPSLSVYKSKFLFANGRKVPITFIAGNVASLNQSYHDNRLFTGQHRKTAPRKPTG